MAGKKGLVWQVAVPLCALLLQGCDGTVGGDDPTYHLTGTEEQPLVGAPGAPPTCPGPKVLVCHIPPGNPANAHSICVGQPAVKAHVRHHGDGLGACGAAISDAGVPPPPPPPPADAGPAADAGPTCQGINTPCTSSAQCCGTMICAEGENLCFPLIQ